MHLKTLLLTFSAVAFLSFGGAGVLWARTWTEAASGKTIQADYAGMNGNKVKLKMANGQVAEADLSRFSAEDQAFVQEQLAAGSRGEVAGSGGAADWPQWRGPDQTDISPETGLLTSWPSKGPEQLWVYDGAGMGYSGYSFAEGKLFTMGSRGEDIMVIALDANTGNELWATKIGTDDPNLGKGDPKGYTTKWGNGPRSTPTYADGKVYALGPEGSFACVSSEDGKVVWSKDLITDFGGKFGGWGFAESPLVDGDKVMICPGGNEAGIVALNKDTGATIWKAEDVKPGKAEYATLMISEMNGVRQYIRFFETEVVSVRAEDGSVLWRAEWPNGKTAVIPTPVVVGNQVYVTSGYGAGSKMFEVGPDNSVKDVWVNSEMKNHHGGVVHIDGYVYGFSDGAGLICQDLKSGELVWNEKGRGMTKGAVHAADGMLYCLDEQEGLVSLVEANPKGFKSHGQFQLDPQSEERSPQGRVWTHPVVINGKLYLRDQQYIHCYDVKSDT